MKDNRWRQFSIDNTNILDVNGDIDVTGIKNWDRYVSSIETKIQSATNGLTRVSKLVDTFGKASATFSVPREYSANAESTLQSTLASVEKDNGLEENSLSNSLRDKQTRMLQYSRSFHGALAQREAKSEMAKLGGSAVNDPTKSFKDRLSLSIPVDEGLWQKTVEDKGGDEGKARDKLVKAFVRENLGSAVKHSDVVSSTEADKEKKAEEEAEKKKKAEEDAENKKREEEDRKKKATLITGLALSLKAILNITKRLLTAVLANASEIKKDSVDSKSLGISYSNMREYKTLARSTGMKEDIIPSALTSLQSSFGDITNIDQKALGELAKVLQGDIVSAINAGLGQNDPEELMKAILNAYYERGQNGINSFGQNIGRYQAERELATALEKAGFKDMADILRTMFYTNDTGIHKGEIEKGNAFDSFASIVKAYTMGITANDNSHISELGTVVDELKAKFIDLKENIGKKLILHLEGLLDKLNNSRIFKSKEEQYQDHLKNVELNKAMRAKLNRDIATTEATVNPVAESLGLKRNKGETWADAFRRIRKSGSNGERLALSTPQGAMIESLALRMEVEQESLKQIASDLKNGAKDSSTIYREASYTEAGRALKVKEKMSDISPMYPTEAESTMAWNTFTEGKMHRSSGQTEPRLDYAYRAKNLYQIEKLVGALRGDSRFKNLKLDTVGDFWKAYDTFEDFAKSANALMASNFGIAEQQWGLNGQVKGVTFNSQLVQERMGVNAQDTDINYSILQTALDNIGLRISEVSKASIGKVDEKTGKVNIEITLKETDKNGERVKVKTSLEGIDLYNKNGTSIDLNTERQNDRGSSE